MEHVKEDIKVMYADIDKDMLFIECWTQISFGIESLEANATVFCLDTRSLAVDRFISTLIAIK